MKLYLLAASQYGLDWAKLAAVGQIESDHGRSAVRGIASGANYAGAAGPAQFITPTWSRYGVDGNHDGTISPYDPADAIPSMAAYLKASGAPGNWPAALFAYNHSRSYVANVLALSRRFSSGAS
jgi:membrane-bound lytic murein transglycosylase B